MIRVLDSGQGDISVGAGGTGAALDDLITGINQTLDHLLSGGLEGVPPGLNQAMRHGVLAGGKRLRPLLFLGAAYAAGWGDWQRLLVQACALELIHAYSLIHDDLPSMDNDDFRRGLPTCHRLFGEAAAILAGDALLSLAFECLAMPVEGVLPERSARAVREVARAAGRQGLVGGQFDDLVYAGRISSAPDAPPAGAAGASAGRRKTGADLLLDISRRKTGALFRAACVAGALLAGGSERDIESLASFAERFGLAFQVADDICDRGPLVAELGTPRARSVVREELEEARAHLAGFSGREVILVRVSEILLNTINDC